MTTIDLTDALARLRTEIVADVLDQVRAERETDPWPGWMDVPTAARYLSVTPGRVRKLIAARRLPYSQEAPGCRVLIERRALDEHLRAMQIGGDA